MANVEEFKQHYLRLCKDHHVDTQECVLKQLHQSVKLPKKGSGYILNLSGCSLTVKTCAVIGKILNSDRTFTEIKLNDCMLPEEGVRAVINGLSSNVFCRRLEIKGNNVRGTATEALGRMFRQNKTLLSLCLEWNAAGMIDTAFGVFCEGLGSNTHLQVLDVRNNQITHDGAIELASALRRNTVLRVLDLRWNNIGLLGGRSLLDSLDFNKTLLKMDLTGNNIPTDVMKSIESSLRNNEDRASLTSEYMAKSQMLSQELQEVRKGQQHQLVDMMDQLDRNETSLRKSTRSASQRIVQLQQALDDRKSQINDMGGKLSILESELALSEAKVNELTTLLVRSREEHGDMAKYHNTEMTREREDRAKEEIRTNKELLEVNDKKMQLEKQIDELERKCKTHQEHIFDLKEQLNHNQADLKFKSVQFDEKLSVEKQRSKEAMRDTEDMRSKEIERIKKECDETEKCLKERIQKLEMHRISLEEDLSKQRTHGVSEKVQYEEQLLAAKQKIRNEEDMKFKALEEKIKLIQTTKDDLQSHATQQSNTVADLQSKNANLVLENETLKRKIQDLNQELNGKNNEIMAEVGKVKIEMNQKIQKLESERRTQAELYEKVSKLEKELEVEKSKHKSDNEERDREINSLKDKGRMKDEEIRQMKDDDAQRTNMLQSALSNYVGRSPFNSGR